MLSVACMTARRMPRAAARASKRRSLGLLVLVQMVCAGGCQGIPDAAYRLPPSSLAVRDVQTRSFAVADESDIIAASVALLQDMDYNLDEVEPPLGLLTASKVVDVDSTAQQVGLIALDVLAVVLAAAGGGSAGGGAYMGADDKVGLQMTLVVLPSLAREGEYTARVTVQSTLWDKAQRIKEQGVIEEPEIYQEIFEKLSRALFLETETQ